MIDNKYNGWTNYETWCVNLWLNNTPGDQEYLMDYVERDDPQGLKESLSEMMPELEASMWSDLLNAAFSEVNWYEIIKGNKDDSE